MPLEVVWTNPALRHLKAIEAYWAQRSTVAADRIISRIQKRSAQLGTFPELGPTGREAGTRELVVVGTRYVLTYRIDAVRISILAVVHGSQGWRGSNRQS